MPRQRLPNLPRTPAGLINNCAIANGASSAECQVCGGNCPDEYRVISKRIVTPTIFDDITPLPEGQQLPSFRRAVRMKVSWGDETIQPVQYNVFHTGSIELEVEVSPDEDVAVIYRQVWAELEKLGAEQYRAKRDGFLDRLTDTAATVRARAKNPSR